MLPGLTTQQMIEMDRIMVEEYGIQIELMMENAGLRLAQAMLDLDGDKTTEFIIVAGGGNNGGGGIVAARRLHAWGFKPMVWLPSKRMREISRKQVNRYLAVGGKTITQTEDFVSFLAGIEKQGGKCVVADAYIGYGFNGPPSKEAEAVFEAISQTKNIISLDAPSGLDTTTGEKYSEFVPKKTVTIAFMKKGMVENPKQLGEVEIIDIGVPKSLFENQLDMNWEIYSLNDLNKLYENFWNYGRVKSKISISKGWVPLNSVF